MTPPRRGAPGGPFSVQEQRVIREAVRQSQLQGNNDPTFVPPVDDFSFIMSVKAFATRGAGQSTAPGRKLTFGAHLTGGSYDGSADVTLATDATAGPDPETLMARDASGFSALVKLILGDTGFIGDTGAGSLDIWPAAPGGHVRFQKHDFSDTNVDIDDDGNVACRGGIGLWGNVAPAQASAPAGAGGTYGATEQAAINDIILRLTELGVYG